MANGTCMHIYMALYKNKREFLKTKKLLGT